MAVMEAIKNSPIAIIIIIALLAVGVVWVLILVLGAAVVFAALAILFWRTILPGIMIFLGLFFIAYGAWNDRFNLVYIGVALMLAGVLISILG